MAKNSNLKYIAMIGGIIGLVGFLIGLFPSDASWWYIKTDGWGLDHFLNPIGYFINEDGEYKFTEDYLILISGLIFLVGSILIIVGSFKESQAVAILSGILMIVSLVIFCIALNTKPNWEDVNGALSPLNDETNLLAGGTSILIWDIIWNLGIGFYVGAVGTGIGIIGALVMNK